MRTPVEIINLIDRFHKNSAAYRSGQYNETQVRREFIDPFFAALGWDISNEGSSPEAYKDVIHEDAIKIGGSTKAPDYCFRVGGARKFFVEAKKPSVNLRDNTSPAFQLRRYAWSANLPLSILTDFEEFVVYDCRIRPDKDDKTTTARTLYYDYSDYTERWEEIAALFSREAVYAGSLDQYTDLLKDKKGVAPVDTAFLREIEAWRELLAKDIALRNQHLSQRELNYAVQMTLDRIIFLRISEDRGIEPYERLKSATIGGQVYKQLTNLFLLADDRYNSGLFHFAKEKDRPEHPDDLTLQLSISDEPLTKIIQSTYYPDSPYEFSVLPIEILGHVYEQFLGKVIHLTSDRQAIVEEKPEVRHVGGVYYTPDYIVGYIVKQTVGQLVEGRTPRQVAKLRIVDPACGSGSFLIGAYQFLLDWHRDWYVNDGPQKHKKELYQGPSSDWRLASAERRRILLSNIYGVDIDAQAVEVTKLSLLLKVLEGENQQTLATQLRMFQERALPDLGKNIKCGNSLIAPEFYDNQQASFFDDEERYRINVFDWQAEFPEIMSVGGFDAVIGNPPYIRMESFKQLKAYLKSHYEVHDERSDLYAYIIERGHKILNKDGVFGMIVSNKFLRSNYGKPLRDFLAHNTNVNRIVDFAGLPVFIGATVRTIILLTSKDGVASDGIYYSQPLPVDKFEAVRHRALPVEQAISDYTYTVSRKSLANTVWSFTDESGDDVLAKIRLNSQRLFEYCNGRICMGVKSGLTDAFVIDAATKDNIIRQNPNAQAIIKPFLNGRDIRRYHIDSKNAFFIYTYHGVNISDYPAVESHLLPFKERLEKRATKQEWYELQQPQLKFSKYMEEPKIIFPDIAVSPRFALDDAGHYSSNTTYFIALRDLYLLGLLNSSLGYFYFIKTCAGLEGKTETYLRFFGQYLEGFPVHAINHADRADKARYDQVVSLVERILELQRRLATAKTGQEKTVLQRQIEATDRQIDRLVYELYGLTDEEIKIIEAGTK
jgi:type I restriction-modification system DNA methylase subunit